MNSVRLEIIQDDPTTAPRLSRIMPAILYKYVPERTFIEFCDRIDVLLNAAATDYRCRANRLSWWTPSVIFWVYLIIIMIFSGQFTSDAGDLGLSYKFLVILIVICVLHLGTIGIWMRRSTGVKPAIETLSEIRAECEAMSNRTPCASFHLVTSPLSMTYLRQYLQKIPIECIEVSISAAGFELLGNMNDGVVRKDAVNISCTNISSNALHPAVHTTSAVNSDYRQLDVV